MNAKVKFQFNTDFDDSELIEEEIECVEELPPEPTFVEADIKAARSDGFARGREEGLREALGSIENALAQSLATVSGQLAAMNDRHTQALNACQQRALALSAAITRKFLPELAQESAIETIGQRISGALPRLIEEPRVVIRVADDMLDPLRDRIETIAESTGFNGHCILLSEPGLTGPDCHIEWADGGAEYDSARMWQEVEDAVDGYLSGMTPISEPTETPSDAAEEEATAETEQFATHSGPQETTHG